MIDEFIKKITPIYGICPFDAVKDKLINCRAVSKIPQNAKSIVVMLFPYKFSDKKYISSDISKYACVRDYHLIISQKVLPVLEELEKKYITNKFVFFSDNSPIPEVLAGVTAGLGVRGKNGLLINKDYGSYTFIGEIVTDLDLSFYENKTKNTCIGCNKCIINCPNGALNNNGLDKEKCLSDITQRKGELSTEQIMLIKSSGCLWGCDICQDVCPMNVGVKINPIDEFKVGFENKIRIDGDISQRAYAWRGIDTIKRNYNIERIDRNETFNSNNKQ